MKTNQSEQLAAFSSYEILDDVVDPIELAKQALVKLRANNLPEVIRFDEPELQFVPQDEIDQIEPEPTAEVYDFSEYKARKKHRVSQGWLVRQAKKGDRNALEQLTADIVPLAKKLAYKFESKYLTFDERTAIAISVIPGCIERYDETARVAFGTYASQRMVGAIKDEVRVREQGEGLSRGNRRRLEEATRNCSPRGIRENIQGLVEEGFINAPAFVDLDTGMVGGNISIEAQLFDSYALEQEGGRLNNSAEIADDEDVFSIVAENFDKEELNNMLEDILYNLSEMERFVIVHKYGLFGEEHKTLREIGEMCGFTESRGSQHHTRGLAKLSGILSRYPDHMRTRLLELISSDY